MQKHKQNITIILFLTLLVLGLFFAFTTFQKQSFFDQTNDREMIELHSNDVKLEVEVVKKPESVSKGLGERDSIGSDGMLFVFEKPLKPTFWMKGMRFSLDFVWIADGTIIGFTENVPPPQDGPQNLALPIYVSPGSVDAVLELESGAVERLGLEVGQSFEIRKP